MCLYDDEQPDQWRQKRPRLLVTKRNGAMVLLEKEVFLSLLEKEISKAVIAFLASVYLLDLDYPAS